MGKIKLEDSGEKIFKLAGKTFLKGQYVIEYTETNTDENGVLTNPEKATVFLRPIAYSQIDRQSSLPFKTPVSWLDFVDSTGAPYADFDTFSEALAIAVANFNSGGATPQYSVYSALLTQSGADAPVVTVLENTLGGTVVWTKQTTGVYVGTLAGAFTVGKTSAIITRSNGFFQIIQLNDVNSFSVITTNPFSPFANVDGRLENTTIEVKVYP